MIRFLSQFFILSPYSFLINDAILLGAIQDGTYDPVVVSLMIVYVLSRSASAIDPPLTSVRNKATLSTDNNDTFPSFHQVDGEAQDVIFAYSTSYDPSLDVAQPTSVDPSFISQPLSPLNGSAPTSSPPVPSSVHASSAVAAVETYLNYAEQTLFNQLAESGAFPISFLPPTRELNGVLHFEPTAATSVSTIQSLLLLGTHYFHTLQPRRAWAIIHCGLICVRENASRRREAGAANCPETRNVSHNSNLGAQRARTDQDLVEDEQCINLWWVFCTYPPSSGLQ